MEKKATEKTKILVERINAMEEWLDHISDSEMRIILRMRYRQGKSWEEIGFVLGYDRRTIARKCEAFLSDDATKKAT